ncbi:MAG: formamidopyrimidine-DNA glycosylase [Bryobacterales bacterium]|nr:formamidopyrimidine-DNA glycosylase [Bryobacterales bacterium]
MPELPDIEVYLEALDARITGHTLRAVRLGNPFLLRSVEPPLEAALGHTVTALRRVGKRIAIGLDNDLWLVLHLMIAGRLHWKKPGVKLAGRNALAAFDFDHGSLTLTEAGSQRKASLLVVNGAAGLAAIDPGGIEVLPSTPAQFAHILRSANHTLKRALTDPKLFSGIGNAYSDEILHHARLSPLQLTQKLTDAEIERLHASILTVMNDWIERLRAEAASGFPEGVTAFRDDMAVHGRFGKPCPVCAAPVQRIRYATNECNYCARCQTGGRVLADRALSRLLGADFPRSLDD